MHPWWQVCLLHHCSSVTVAHIHSTDWPSQTHQQSNTKITRTSTTHPQMGQSQFFNYHVFELARTASNAAAAKRWISAFAPTTVMDLTTYVNMHLKTPMLRSWPCWAQVWWTLHTHCMETRCVCCVATAVPKCVPPLRCADIVCYQETKMSHSDLQHRAFERIAAPLGW